MMKFLSFSMRQRGVLEPKALCLLAISTFLVISLFVLIILHISTVKHDEKIRHHFSDFQRSILGQVFEAHKAALEFMKIYSYSVKGRSLSEIKWDVTRFASPLTSHLPAIIKRYRPSVREFLGNDPLDIWYRYNIVTGDLEKDLDIINVKLKNLKLAKTINDAKKIINGIKVYGVKLTKHLKELNDIMSQISSTHYVIVRNDLNNKFTLYRWIEFAILVLVFVTGGTGTFTFLIIRSSRTALQRAHDDLEAKVDERTSELLMANQRLNEAARIASLGYWIWDEANDKIIDCSEGYARIYGTAKEQMLTRANSNEVYYPFVHPDDRDLVAKAVRTLRVDREPYDIEYRVLRQDGSVCHIREIGNPIFDEAGQLVQSSGITQDITERKHMEFELAHSRKMQAVGKLTGGIAHEFNNLLQAIMGNLHMLRDYPGDENETAEMLDDAIAASRRGGNLTQQLLSFSRKQILSPKVIDINDSLSDISRLLKGTIGEGITLETKLAKDLVSVNIDPGSFESALLNLALNARSAMPKGGALTIDTANVRLEEAIPRNDDDLPAGRYVGITVSDTGCGMPPEVLERAFEPFFTTRDVGEGTGLGLSMVYGFIRQSGGHVTIDSDPGKGTSVRMYLPIAEAEEIKKPDKPENGKTETKESGTILVVEDEPKVRQATVRFLKRIGYEVLGVGDGPSALKVLLRRGDIDLVFSDVFMPEDMSGIDLVEEIQRTHKGVKVLLNSGYPISEIDEDGTLEDRFVFLRKPYSNEQLAAAVKAVMDG